MSPRGKCQTVDMKMRPADLRNLTELNPADPKNLTRPEVIERLGDRVLHQDHSAHQRYYDQCYDDDAITGSGTALVHPESLQEASGDGHEFRTPTESLAVYCLFYDRSGCEVSLH